MITCGKCQRPNEDHYKFCLGCGTPLNQAPPEPAEPEPAPAADAQAPAEDAPNEAAAESTGFVTCPTCVARVPSGHSFCLSCGSPIPDDAEQAPAPELTPAADVPPAAEPAQAEPAAAAAVVAPEAAVEPAAAVVAPDAAAAEPQNQPLAHLIMVNPDGTPGDSVPLHEGANTIGRNSDHAVLAKDAFLSPQHATLTVSSDGVVIQDLDSINGVFYRITEPTKIMPGDYIRLGREVFLLQSASEFPAAEGLESDQGSPLGSAYGRVARVSAPNNGASYAFLLHKDEHTIGRERGDVTIPDDGFVSGLHARIYREDGNVFIEDLQSSNGTYVRIKGSRTVKNNALLLIGEQPFRVKFVE